MSILKQQQIGGGKESFIFDSSINFDKMIRSIKNGNQINGIFSSSVTDKQNFFLLKQELGMEEQELQLRRLMTKNNDIGENNIQNNYNNKKYQLVERINDRICLQLMDFIDFASWIEAPNKLVDVNNSVAQEVNPQKQYSGKPQSKIFAEIRKVLPFLHNLYTNILEEHYKTGVSVQIQEYQDLQQRLDQASLTGQAKQAKSSVKQKIKK